jgi:hypothetical protein
VEYAIDKPGIALLANTFPCLTDIPGFGKDTFTPYK